MEFDENNRQLEFDDFRRVLQLALGPRHRGICFSMDDAAIWRGGRIGDWLSRFRLLLHLLLPMH